MKKFENSLEKGKISNLLYFIISAVILLYVVGFILSDWDDFYYKEFSLIPIKAPKNATFLEEFKFKTYHMVLRSKNGYKLFFNSILCSIKTFSFKGPYLGTLWQILYLPKRIFLFLIKIPLKILHFIKYVFCLIKRGKFVRLVLCDIKRIIIYIWKVLYYIKVRIIRLICLYCNIMQPPVYTIDFDDSPISDDVLLPPNEYNYNSNIEEIEDEPEEPCYNIIKKQVYVTKEIPVYKYVEPTNCPKPESITEIEYKDVYDEIDSETTTKLRTLISDILTKQKELDTMLDNAEKEIKEIKEVIATLKPSISQEDVSNILNSLTNMDSDIDKLVNEALTSINEKLKEISMKEREVSLSYNGNILKDSPIIINTRDIPHITLKFDHPAFVTRLVINQNIEKSQLNYATENDVITDLTIQFISRGHLLTSSSLNLEKQNSLILEKPILCDSVNLVIKGHKGEGQNSVVPLLSVFESPL